MTSYSTQRTRSFVKGGAAVSAFAPVVIALAAILPLVGAIAGAIAAKLVSYFDLLPVGDLTWFQAFLVGGLLAYGSGFLRAGSILVTPWVTMLFLGAVHLDVYGTLSPLGFLPLLAIYLCCLPLRLVLSPTADSSD